MADPYYLASRFKDKKKAGDVYFVVQELIYQDVDCDLSAFRVMLNGLWHVVVLGEKPAENLYLQLEAQLTNGTLVTLDPETILWLTRRREQATQIGPWVEGHYDLEEP